jgi:hypothetical protein
MNQFLSFRDAFSPCFDRYQNNRLELKLTLISCREESSYFMLPEWACMSSKSFAAQTKLIF